MNVEQKARIVESASRVVVAGTTLGLTSGAILDAVNDRIPIVVAAMPDSQRTADNCVIRVGVLAQEFEDRGGPTFADGRPRFQPEIDRIIGPVIGRDYLVKALTSKEISALLTTNPQGEGVDPRTGRNYVEFTGKGEVIDGQPKMTITNKSQDSGDEIRAAVTCGNNFTDQRYIDRGRAEIKVGQGPTVLPKGTEIITTPAATSEPRRVEVSPTQRVEQPSPSPTTRAEVPQPPQTQPPSDLLTMIHDTPVPVVGWIGDRIGNTGNLTRWGFDNKWPIGVFVLAAATILRPTRRIVFNSVRFPDRRIRRWTGTYAGPLWP